MARKSRKYTRSVNIPFSEVIKEAVKKRKYHFQHEIDKIIDYVHNRLDVAYDKVDSAYGKLNKKLNEVYSSNNPTYIEKFEHDISNLVQAIKGTEIMGLEGILVSVTKDEPIFKKDFEGKRLKRKIDRRPRLTHYQYEKARDEGMSNDEIKERFRLDHPKQLGGFAKAYKTKRKEAIVTSDKKPRLTYDLYLESRKKGMVHSQIKEEFLCTALQARSFAANYSRRLKGEKKVKKAKGILRKKGKPKLTWELAKEEIETGLSNEEIKEKYDADGRQIHGFRRAYQLNIQEKENKRSS